MTDIDDLPHGWAWTTLGEIGIWSGGGTPFKGNAAFWAGGSVPWVSPKDMKRTHVADSEDHITTHAVETGEAKLLEPGAVLVVVRSGILQRTLPVAVTTARVTINQDLKALQPHAFVLPEFVVNHLRCESQEILANCCKSGTTVANIELPRFWAFRFPLPPLAEQRRIVAKVEELTARSSAARAALAEVPTLLEQFRQSVLASAFRGDLTANWREKHPDTEPAAVLLASIRDERRKQWEAKYPKKKYVAPDPVDDADLPELPVGWEYARADEVVAAGTVITYGIVLPGDQVEGGVPYVRGQDIEDGRILVEQLARTSPEIAARHDRSSLLEGDVLLCIIRHLKVAVVPAGMDGANLTQGTVRLRPSDAILGPYLAGYLAGPTAQGWMKERYFGMAMPRINVEDARAIPIPVAPLEEQREIIRQIEVTGRRHQAVVAAVNQALDEMNDLDQSILAKAFCGELVPQDSADEPASVLLDRIRREREAGTNGTAAAPKKRRTKSQ